MSMLSTSRWNGGHRCLRQKKALNGGLWRSMVIRGEQRSQTMALVGDESWDLWNCRGACRWSQPRRCPCPCGVLCPRFIGNARSATVIFGRLTQPCYPASVIGRPARRAVKLTTLNGLTVPDANEFRD